MPRAEELLLVEVEVMLRVLALQLLELEVTQKVKALWRKLSFLMQKVAIAELLLIILTLKAVTTVAHQL